MVGPHLSWEQSLNVCVVGHYTLLQATWHCIACNSVIISLCSISNGSFRNWRNLMKQLHG